MARDTERSQIKKPYVTKIRVCCSGGIFDVVVCMQIVSTTEMLYVVPRVYIIYGTLGRRKWSGCFLFFCLLYFSFSHIIRSRNSFPYCYSRKQNYRDTVLSDLLFDTYNSECIMSNYSYTDHF